jgi:sulfonate transport system permease protein
MTLRRLPTSVLGVLGLLALILLWHLVTAAGLVSKAFLPSPAATADALVWGLGNGDLKGQLAATTLRMLNGWLLASIGAIALGSLVGIRRRPVPICGRPSHLRARCQPPP